MAKKITVKNPGCQFCRYYQESFRIEQKETLEACTKGAHRIFRKNENQQHHEWKWIRCKHPQEKNKNRLCQKFQIPIFFATFWKNAYSRIFRLGEQQKPSFGNDKWWQ
ncbi:MAG: hypothetical protein ACI86H_001367 [bacterium]|jgi:hypothetical protein